MQVKPRLPVFFLVSLGLVLCYWWFSRPSAPSAPLAGWAQLQPLLQAQALDQLQLDQLKAVFSGQLVAEGEQRYFRADWPAAGGWQVNAQLAGNDKVQALNLQPQQAPSLEALKTTLGAPRLNLELEGGRAWVYPAQGMTLHFAGEQLHLLRVVPAQQFRSNGASAKTPATTQALSTATE